MWGIQIGKVSHWIIKMIYLISLFVLLFDLLTKHWAINTLTFGVPQPLFPLFNLTLVANRGISFSMLTADNRWGVLFLIIAALVICGFIVYMIQKENDIFSKIALAMILGGAIGNIWDRIRYGFVIDFLDFYWGKYHFPTFNIADSFICIGVGLLLLKMMKKEKKNA